MIKEAELTDTIAEYRETGTVENAADAVRQLAESEVILPVLNANNVELNFDENEKQNVKEALEDLEASDNKPDEDKIQAIRNI